MSEVLATLIYNERKREVCWQGHQLLAGTTFDTFLSTNVADRFFDKEGSSDFESHLRGLAVTGFAQSNLQQILAVKIEEERDWVVGEAIAEAWLCNEYSVIWPWNMERDKRTPRASLPGADLVGFYKTDDETRLLIGEVKTSGENYFMDDSNNSTKAMTKCGQNLFGKLTHTASWGLGALLSITAGDLPEEEFKELSNLPSRVYYGVNDDSAIALRLLGIPRTAARPMAIAMADLMDQPLPKIRAILSSLPENKWELTLGEQSGKVYRKVWLILEGLE